MMVSSRPHVAPRGMPSSVARVIAGPPVTATFFKHVAAVHESDPAAIGGDERPGRRAGEHRQRLEGVERADEELRAVVADIDDAGAVRRDRQVVVGATDRSASWQSRTRSAGGRHEARPVQPGAWRTT